jgi:hypothetical protein
LQGRAFDGCAIFKKEITGHVPVRSVAQAAVSLCSASLVQEYQNGKKDFQCKCNCAIFKKEITGHVPVRSVAQAAASLCSASLVQEYQNGKKDFQCKCDYESIRT